MLHFVYYPHSISALYYTHPLASAQKAHNGTVLLHVTCTRVYYCPDSISVLCHTPQAAACYFGTLHFAGTTRLNPLVLGRRRARSRLTTPPCPLPHVVFTVSLSDPLGNPPEPIEAAVDAPCADNDWPCSVSSRRARSLADYSALMFPNDTRESREGESTAATAVARVVVSTSPLLSRPSPLLLPPITAAAKPSLVPP